jgi:hypothetical protein
VNAQNIHLQKNQTLKKNGIKLPKMLSIEYKDSGNIKSIRGKGIQYKFPFLFLVEEKDTFRIDVKNVSKIKYNNSIVAPLVVVGFGLTSVASIAGLLDFLNGNYYEGFLFIGAGYIAYNLYRKLPKEFDTKTEWHFY